MWNETLELHPARRLKEDNSIVLESGLKLRPEIFDIGCSDHSPALFLLLERFSNSPMPATMSAPDSNARPAMSA